jgi:hypothetical protein
MYAYYFKVTFYNTHSGENEEHFHALTAEGLPAAMQTLLKYYDESEILSLEVIPTEEPIIFITESMYDDIKFGM